MMKFLPAAIAACALSVAGTVTAAHRTFVASQGLDANPCSLVLPCRTFASAIALTDAGGEVVVLNSAGYGAVTIGKSVTLVAPPGVYAGITVFSGDGVTVSAAGSTVALRGLTIVGQGGANGIAFLQGAQLLVERCTVGGMTFDGINAAATGGEIVVSDSDLRWNGGYGLRIQAPGGGLVAVVDRSRFDGNSIGLYVAANGSLVLRDSVVTRNASGGIWATAGPQGDTMVAVSRSAIVANGGVGVGATAGSGTRLMMSIVGSEIVGNGVAGLRAYANQFATSAILLELSGSAVSGNLAGEGIDLLTANGAWLRAIVAGSTISGNATYGIGAAGSLTSVTATRNVVAKNATYGFQQATAAVFRSAGDNVIEYSGLAPTAGTITPTGPGY